MSSGCATICLISSMISSLRCRLAWRVASASAATLARTSLTEATRRLYSCSSGSAAGTKSSACAFGYEGFAGFEDFVVVQTIGRRCAGGRERHGRTLRAAPTYWRSWASTSALVVGVGILSVDSEGVFSASEVSTGTSVVAVVFSETGACAAEALPSRACAATSSWEVSSSLMRVSELGVR